MASSREKLMDMVLRILDPRTGQTVTITRPSPLEPRHEMSACSPQPSRAAVTGVAQPLAPEAEASGRRSCTTARTGLAPARL